MPITFGGNPTPSNVLTLPAADTRFGTTFNVLSGQTGNLNVQEWFDDFIKPEAMGWRVSNVRAGGGTAGSTLANNVEGDIWLPSNTLIGPDRYNFKGVVGLQTSGTVHSTVSFSPAITLGGSNAMNTRVTVFSTRFHLAKSPVNVYFRVNSIPVGGQYSPDNILNLPSLCFDYDLSGNRLFFSSVSAGSNSTFNYTNSFDTGIDVLSGTWYNMKIQRQYSSVPTLTGITLSLYNEVSGVTFTTLFTAADINNNFGNFMGGCPGIMLGHRDPSGGNIARKTMVFDWWYTKFESLTSLPVNWEANRYNLLY